MGRTTTVATTTTTTTLTPTLALTHSLHTNSNQVEFCTGHGLSLDNIVPQPKPPLAANACRPKMPHMSKKVTERSERTTVVKTIVHQLPPTEDIPSVVCHDVNAKVCEVKRDMVNKWKTDCIERSLLHKTEIDNMQNDHSRQARTHTHTHTHIIYNMHTHTGTDLDLNLSLGLNLHPHY